MPKTVNWENVKDDIQEYWPDYVNAAEINAKGYKNEDSIKLILDLMVQAGEVETDPKSKKTEPFYRANHGTPAELADQAITFLDNLIKYINKRFRLEKEVQEVIAFLVKLRRLSKEEAEYFQPGFTGDVPAKFVAEPMADKKKKSKEDTSTRGMTEGEKVRRSPQQRSKINIQTLIAEILQGMEEKQGSNVAVHQALSKDGVEIALEQVQKGLTTMSARKFVARVPDITPATYKLKPEGERYLRQHQ